jgi:hypothetical protein
MNGVGERGYVSGSGCAGRKKRDCLSVFENGEVTNYTQTQTQQASTASPDYAPSHHFVLLQTKYIGCKQVTSKL